MNSTSSAARVLNAWRDRDQQAGHTPPPVITHARTANLVLEDAEVCRLPVPCDVLISSVTVDLHFDTLSELTEWAVHLGESIATEVEHLGPFGSMAFHTIEADLYGINVRFTTSNQVTEVTVTEVIR